MALVISVVCTQTRTTHKHTKVYYTELMLIKTNTMLWITEWNYRFTNVKHFSVMQNVYHTNKLSVISSIRTIFHMKYGPCLPIILMIIAKIPPRRMIHMFLSILKLTMKLEYSAKIRPKPWLSMPWFPMSSRHRQSWHWVYKTRVKRV